MIERDERQVEQCVELSSEELEQVRGGGNAEIFFVEVASGPYQGQRSTGGYVPT